MNHREVPQESNTAFAGQRKAMYAVDDQGRYTTVPSNGWKVEEIVTGAAVEEYRRLAADARVQVEAGQVSTLAFHMYDRRMDEPLLAATAGVSRWRLRRHLLPRHFVRLSPAWICRYAAALGMSPADVVRLPPAPEPP